MRSASFIPRRGVWLAALLALGASAPDPAGPPPAPLTLDWCLERARETNPALAVSAASAAMARARAGYSGSLEDPRISYEASNVPAHDRDFDSTPLSGHQLMLRQKLPFPGLLGQREQAARAGADAADSDLGDRQRSVAAAVEAAWAGLGFAQRALAITERNVDLLRQLTRIAESRYRVGSGLQQDVLRAQVELTRLIEERLGREADVASADARLGALLDLPGTDPMPETAALEEAAPVPPLAPLLERAPERNPRLAALRARVTQAEKLRAATQLESYPDFDLSAGYRVRERVAGDAVNGDDFLSAGVTIRLPIDRGKWRTRVAEQSALLRRARAQYRAERSEVRARVLDTHAALVRSDQQSILVATGLLPQARQSLDSSRSGYEVGRVDFPSLLDSQVRLLEAELRLVRLQAERRSAFAALESAVGEVLR